MSQVGYGLAATAIAASTVAVVTQTDAIAQSDSTEGSQLKISPAALAEIREAPFSELFIIGDNAAYAVKDQDYNPAEPDLGLFTLWGNVPARDALGVAVKYCFEDTQLAAAGAELVEMQLMDGDATLATIDEVVTSRASYLNEIRPPRVSNVSSSFYFDPFYDPFYYSPFSVGFSYAPPSYIPGVECSTGTVLFDLTPVQAEIAALPEQTLKVRLLFNNGQTEFWQLGGQTVRELKRLPTIESQQ
ncbi:MAG: hypothetical protein ACFBSG_05405 [Leptolyngbyaceae cyanobacterium]